MLNRNKDFNLTLNSFLKIWFSSTTDGNKDLVRLPVRLEMRRGKGGEGGRRGDVDLRKGKAKCNHKGQSE